MAKPTLVSLEVCSKPEAKQKKSGMQRTSEQLEKV